MIMAAECANDNFPSKPHQPANFKFPKRTFGKKNIVHRSFQSSWFSQWSFLHYDEARDLTFCHMCVMTLRLKQIKANRADPAFVSIN